jgi:eukaryotic-like serine/threonine-protein kinase
MLCPVCSAGCREGMRFCGQCGSPLDAAAGRSSSAGLRPGESFLGKYRIERLLGQGAMGVVYLALDPYIGRRVALKTLRLDGDQPEGRLDSLGRRLAREAQAAGRLSHPNIVVVHEAGEAEGQHYIVMEYVEGPTLAELLAASGALPRQRALGIVRQIARALGYAHARGILHRDVKPSNVMICEDDHVKVADFGLAKLLSDETVLTQDGGIVGTPAYMSPEQIRSLPLDGRSDLFSLAAVLYECVSGMRPFESPQLHQLLYQILEAPHRPLPWPDSALLRAWSGFFDRALAKDPAERLQGPAFLAELDRLAALAPAEAPLLPAAGVGVPNAELPTESLDPDALACTAVPDGPGPSTTRLEPALPERAASAAGRRSVAVLGFKNLSGRPETGWLSVGLSEMLGTELAAGEDLRIVPGESVARMKLELTLSETDSYSPETLARIRANLSADLVVLGSYLALGEKSGGRIRLDVRLQDAAAGETLASIAETGTEVDLFDLVTRVGSRLREKLGTAERPAEVAHGVRGSLPRTPEAARLYAEGLTRLRLFDTQGALDRLERAAAAEPEFPLVQAALAEAWTALGHEQRARGAARLAVELGSSLPRQERLFLEARYHECSRQWLRAAEIYRMLSDFFPDQLDYALRLASALVAAGRAVEALETLSALRRRVPEAAADGRVELAEAEAALATSEHRRMLSAARRAAEHGEAQSARLLVAAARRLEGRAHWRLGEPANAIAAWDAAKLAYRAGGDLRGLAATLHWEGTFYHTNLDDLDRALAVLEEALALYRRIGNRRGLGEVLFNIGQVHKDLGDPAGARAAFEEALEAIREVGAEEMLANTLKSLAQVHAVEGDERGAGELFDQALALARASGVRGFLVFLLAEAAETLGLLGHRARAEAMLLEAAELARESGAKLEVALVLARHADLLCAWGRLDEAAERYDESLQIARAIASKSRTAYALHAIGRLLLLRADLAGARKHYEEAQRIRQDAGNRLIDSRIALAELLLEEGNAQAAADELERVAVETAAGRWAAAEGNARLPLARALLSLGRRDEARREGKRACELAGRVLDRRLAMAAAVTAACIDEDLGALEAASARAARLGLEGTQLEAALALAEIQLGRNPEAGRVRLEELELLARGKGFGLVAAKARRALGGASA